MCNPAAIGLIITVASTVMQKNAANKAEKNRESFTRRTIEKQDEAQRKNSQVIDNVLRDQNPDSIQEQIEGHQEQIQGNLHEQLQSAQSEASDASIGGKISDASRTKEAADLAGEAESNIELARLFSKIQAPKEAGFERAITQQRGAEQIAMNKNFLAGDAAVNQLGFNAVPNGGSVIGDIGSAIGGNMIGKGLGGGSLAGAFASAPWTGKAGNIKTTWG